MRTCLHLNLRFDAYVSPSPAPSAQAASQYLYICTSKARKMSTSNSEPREGVRRGWAGRPPRRGWAGRPPAPPPPPPPPPLSPLAATSTAAAAARQKLGAIYILYISLTYFTYFTCCTRSEEKDANHLGSASSERDGNEQLNGGTLLALLVQKHLFY